jgi:radical S-adenosyl methionine domain-containing protein 2
MASSYLLLDEYMCFPDKGEGTVTKSESILEVGVRIAMDQVVYNWSRSAKVQQSNCDGGNDREELQW